MTARCLGHGLIAVNRNREISTIYIHIHDHIPWVFSVLVDEHLLNDLTSTVMSIQSFNDYENEH